MSSEKELLLRVAGVKKSYDLYDSPYKCLLQILFKGHYNFSKQFKALDGIDFTLHRGECLGIIGRNGAGKSTLLAILGGRLSPTEGVVERRGKSCALLELGFGFNGDFTGRENIAVAGLMMGMTKSELESKTESIIRFADINEFIDQPVKKYSSGMFVRLAFSLVAHTDSQIRLVDEALAVGDIFFQQKCFRLLEEQKKTSALVLVSHDMTSVANLCDRVLVLEKGQMVFYGAPKEAIEFYTHLLYQTAPAAPQTECSECLIPIPEKHRTGQYGNLIGASLNHKILQAKDILHITAQAILHKDCPIPIIGYFFSDHFGKRIFGHCRWNGKPLAAGKIQFSFDLEWPDIAPGEYTLTLGIGSGEDIMTQTVYCWATDFCVVTVIKEKDIVHGVFNVEINNFQCREIGR